MSGGLMQLVAYGAQDIYLTGNPQITFFKVVYRRHTSFSMESIEQTFNGSADFGKKVTSTISRNGDLIHKTYLQVVLPSVTVPKQSPSSTERNGFRWLNWVGHILVKTCELEIGGQRIDKHYAAWLHIWNELTQTPGHALGYANMVGNVPELTSLKEATTTDVVVPGKTLYIPLQFFYCRNPGLALPLIALQYHEVKINVELAPVEDCYWSGVAADSTSAYATDMSIARPGSLAQCSLWVDFIYLDTSERRRFAQVSHEYLIDQLQFTGDESTTGSNFKAKLNFNHPVKEIIWVVQPNDHTSVNSAAAHGKQWFNFTDADDSRNNSDVVLQQLSGSGGTIPTGENPVVRAKIQLNGHDRFAERSGSYFNLVQPYQHHTNVPSKGINVYSFALMPEEHQASGTCNMSRIDNATLQLSLTDATVANGARVKVFAVNYNVLRIMSGMGGLSYSN